MSTEILISDFNSTRVPSDFSLGDGSWNGDYDLSGSDLKIGVSGTATTDSGCSASFSAIDCTSLVFADSHAYVALDCAWGIYGSVKVTLLSSGGEISWTTSPVYGWAWSRHQFTTDTRRFRIPLCGWAARRFAGGLWGESSEQPSVDTINWSAVTGFKIEGISGFAALPFVHQFNSLKVIKE